MIIATYYLLRFNHQLFLQVRNSKALEVFKASNRVHKLFNLPTRVSSKRQRVMSISWLSIFKRKIASSQTFPKTKFCRIKTRGILFTNETQQMTQKVQNRLAVKTKRQFPIRVKSNFISRMKAGMSQKKGLESLMEF